MISDAACSYLEYAKRRSACVVVLLLVTCDCLRPSLAFSCAFYLDYAFSPDFSLDLDSCNTFSTKVPMKPSPGFSLDLSLDLLLDLLLDFDNVFCLRAGVCSDSLISLSS